jgi:mannosyltransferase PIG-V
MTSDMQGAAGKPSRASWARILCKEDWLVVGWVLSIKILLFVFGAKSFRILENKPLPGKSGWLEIWNRWDSLHYLQVAQFGYNAASIMKAWFYPLFPWSTRLVAYVAGNYFVSALIVSGCASVAAAILLRRIVQFDHDAGISRWAVWFFLIFPTAYYLHIGYSESLFLALVLGSILAALFGRWWLAGVLGALSWMTRPNGIILLPTLAVEAVHQWVVTRRWNWRWLWIAIVPAGFAVYLLVNWRVTGDPFTFLRMRKKLFAMESSWPWVGIRSAIGNLRRTPNQAEIVGAQELYFAALGFVCMIVSWFKLRPVHAAWITGNWFLVTSVTFMESVPRYVLTMYPVFILFALLSQNRLCTAIITVWSLLFLALFSSVFIRGWWVF